MPFQSLSGVVEALSPGSRSGPAQAPERSNQPSGTWACRRALVSPRCCCHRSRRMGRPAPPASPGSTTWRARCVVISDHDQRGRARRRTRLPPCASAGGAWPGCSARDGRPCALGSRARAAISRLLCRARPGGGLGSRGWSRAGRGVPTAESVGWSAARAAPTRERVLGGLELQLRASPRRRLAAGQPDEDAGARRLVRDAEVLPRMLCRRSARSAAAGVTGGHSTAPRACAAHRPDHRLALFDAQRSASSSRAERREPHPRSPRGRISTTEPAAGQSTWRTDHGISATARLIAERSGLTASLGEPKQREARLGIPTRIVTAVTDASSGRGGGPYRSGGAPPCR